MTRFFRQPSILVIVFAAPLLAQTDSAAKPIACWRGRPAPQCTMFWISEVGYDGIVSTTHEQSVVTRFGRDTTISKRHFDNSLVLTVGPMFNTQPLRAIGGTLSISAVDNGPRVAVEVRRRWWTPEGSALDLSAGPVGRSVPHLDPSHARMEFGLTTAAYLVGGDVIHVDGRVDLLLTDRKPIVGTSLGLGFGSRTAVYGTIICGLILMGLLRSGGAST